MGFVFFEIIFITVFSFGEPACIDCGEDLEKECSTIEIDVARSLKEPRDQGDIGWCFAHAAADVASQALGKKISAMDLAMNYYLEKGAMDWQPIGSSGALFHRKKSIFMNEGGWENRALDFANRNGYCLEANFRSDLLGKKAILEFLEL